MHIHRHKHMHTHTLRGQKQFQETRHAWFKNQAIFAQLATSHTHICIYSYVYVCTYVVDNYMQMYLTAMNVYVSTLLHSYVCIIYLIF